MRNLYRKILFCLFVICCSATTALASEITVKIDGNALSLSAPAIIENDRVLVPMRSIMEALEFEVVWEQETKGIHATKDDVQIDLAIDRTTAMVNAEEITLDTAPMIYQDSTMVPLRFVATHSGAKVSWDNKTKTVSIITNDAYDPNEQLTIEEMTESVVYIQTDSMQGSGIILSEDGLIATNFHVIDGMTTFTVVFSDGEVFRGGATVVGLDPDRDIAIIKIAKTGLKPVQIETNFKVGDDVIAIGSPLGERNVATTGEILDYTSSIIATNALINRGSSGGALFSASGKLLGMTSSLSDSEYFSIPASMIVAVPTNLNISVSEMKDYQYVPKAPRGLEYAIVDGYVQIAWGISYDVDWYYIYVSEKKGDTYTKLKVDKNSTDQWQWGFPYALAMTIENGKELDIRVSAVKNGVESPLSEPTHIVK